MREAEVVTAESLDSLTHKMYSNCVQALAGDGTSSYLING